MSDKSTTLAAASKATRTKRASVLSAPSTSSRMRVPPSAMKERQAPRVKINKNATVIGDADVTMMRQESCMPNFDAERRKIAYGNFLRGMMEECMLDEKIEREQTEMDNQMVQLADRFQKTVDVLDKTNRRIKDVSFMMEQKRLLDLKSRDSDSFYEETDSSNARDLVQHLYATEQVCLNKLETRNIDFGYNKDSGHKQLLDAVNEAIDGLEQIKSQSKLDLSKFKEYVKSETVLLDLEKDQMDLNTLKAEFEEKFPKFSEKLLEEMTEKIANAFVDDSSELSRQLDLWLGKADLTHGPARAVISPHAGYAYCGACAAFAYRQISPVVVKRIFILGPSHHVRLGGCALSSLDKYSTPLYDLTIDKQIYAELEATRQFQWMDTQTDEDEHSIEMQLPYIAKVMEEYQTGFTIIPILVGSLTTEKEAKYGSILAPYLADPQNLVVISSDFCHWGSRFRYTWRDGTDTIYQSIERLDRQGMDLIEKMDPEGFSDYLKRFGNTICGRHPIGVLLQAISKLRSQQNAPNMSLKFLKYAQSSQCVRPQDSSVSYASAALVFE